jgi:hypothetical protein
VKSLKLKSPLKAKLARKKEEKEKSISRWESEGGQTHKEAPVSKWTAGRVLLLPVGIGRAVINFIFKTIMAQTHADMGQNDIDEKKNLFCRADHVFYYEHAFFRNKKRLCIITCRYVDVNYSGFDYSVLLRPLTFNDTAKGFFLKFGGHRSQAEADIRITSGSVSLRASSKDSGSGTLYGLGYDFSFSKNMFGRASVTEYKKVAGISDNDGTVYSFGLGYKF